MTFKFDGWPRKIIGHLFYTTSSFVHHFKSISKFKLELQSGNAQFGSKLTIFLAVWPRNLTDDLEKQLGTSSMLLQALCIILWPTMSQFYIHYINAKFRHNLFHKYTDIHIGIFWFTVPHVQINKQKVHFNTSKPGFKNGHHFADEISKWISSMNFLNEFFYNFAIQEFYFLNIIYILLYTDLISILFRHLNILTRAPHHWCFTSKLYL